MALKRCRIKNLGKQFEGDNDFPMIYFVDHYQDVCSLQVSSLAHSPFPGKSAIWLGRENHRMHLTRTQVKALIRHLKNWIRKGEFV